MGFPPHIAAILEQGGVAADTRSALFDLYLTLGSPAVAAFADLSDRLGGPHHVTPEDLGGLKAEVTEIYLRAAHPRWLSGEATASLWHPREAEGRAAGLVVPMGQIGASAEGELAREVERPLAAMIGEKQPVPRGALLLGRNAHYGGRANSLTFDIVPTRLEDALAIAAAEGRQHTVPGSVGETTATADMAQRVGLVWEIQPNVLKPQGTRNRSINAVYRRQRNWHLGTLTAAFLWLRRHKLELFVVQGAALAATHQVNDAQPVPPEIVALHDRTVAKVISALGWSSEQASDADTVLLLATELMNTGLRRHVLEHGGEGVFWRVRPVN